MNKTEILAELSSRDFVGELVGEPKYLETLQGFDATGKLVDTDTRVYVQRYLEVVGLAARPKEVQLFIKGDSAKGTETAYYVNNEPTRSIPVWDVTEAEPVKEPV